MSGRMVLEGGRIVLRGVAPDDVRPPRRHVPARVRARERACALPTGAPVQAAPVLFTQPPPRPPGDRPELAELVRRYRAGLRNFWLCGPAGSGKSTLAPKLAERLGVRFAGQSFADDVTSSALVGGPDVSGTYRETAFIDFYTGGGVYLLDELDAADPSILIIVNAALANGHLYLPRHSDPARRVLKRHPDAVVVGAGNTWGTGPTAEYVGRRQLDAAFLSRFACAKFLIDYNRDLERSLFPSDRAGLLSELWRMRDRLQAERIRRVLGTREVEAAALLARAGYSDGEVVEALWVDWTEQERAKVGAAA